VPEPEGSSALFIGGSRETLSGSSALALEHLQMNPLVTSSLHAAGLRTIADVLEFVRSPEYATYRYRPEMRATLGALDQATTGNETDWPLFWNLIGGIFYQLAADLPKLRWLSAKARQQPVDRETFGNAGAMLHRAGFDDLGKLVDSLYLGIPAVRGIGGAKLQDFFRELIDVESRIDGQGNVALLTSSENDKPLTSDTLQEPITFSPGVRRLSSGILHLGAKTRSLAAAGYATIGQIMNEWPLIAGRGLGASTLMQIRDRIGYLHMASKNSEEVDWDAYCVMCAIPLVPSSERPATGADFLTGLSGTLVELASHLPDDVYVEILRSRLSKLPGEQKTLEEIGQTAIPPITRERVRQKERKLLKQLAGGLIWDSYSGLGVHFRPSFSGWWRIAAGRFRDTEDIDFNDFVSTLAEAWEVDVPSLTAQLPIILAIVTGEPQMPTSFRMAIRIDPRLYGELIPEVKNLALRTLRMGRYADQLSEQGITTLGDLVEFCRSGEIEKHESAATRSARSQLDILGACLGTDGRIIWPSYRASLGLGILPETVTTDAAQFTEELSGVVERFLRYSPITARAADIFRLRTSQPEQLRLTLEKTAEALQSHAPSVKREETVFLQHLNDVLVGKEYTHAPVWLDESWLAYWAEAARIFASSEGSFQTFERELLCRWELAGADKAIVTLWAVLSGYPNGRPSSRRKISVASGHVPQQGGRIRLRGFRRVH
tara:strand:+ start:5609 stop:7762 length:2154 start_codon:yes stop_codon:yes gene_type:complete